MASRSLSSQRSDTVSTDNLSSLTLVLSYNQTLSLDKSLLLLAEDMRSLAA